MLRITIKASKEMQTIQLEGKIVGPWVEEFDRAWHALETDVSKSLRLDLCGVDFVDDRGRRLLQDIYRKTHASFLANSPLTHYFADEAMRQKSHDREQGA
jgi:anti-anti-sigma regulatory factor